MGQDVNSIVKKILSIEKEELRRQNKNRLLFYNTGEKIHKKQMQETVLENYFNLKGGL